MGDVAQVLKGRQGREVWGSGQRQTGKGREEMTEHEFSFSVLLKVTFASHLGILLCCFHLKGLIFLHVPHSPGVTFIRHEGFDKGKM